MTTIDDTHDMRVALDPGRSVVIDACAGSGKTWLLVSRVVRLLLAGVSPSEILAITFTRKAAQEMRARLSKWLRQLATQSDAEVIEFLRERGIADEDLDRALVRARSLFEISLSAQPPITIETFHGWFLQILERAPFNTGGASVPSGFSLEARVAFLLDEAWDLFGAMLRLPANAALAAGFDELCADLGYATVRRLIARFMQKRAEWWAYTLGQSDAVGFALAELQEILAVEPDGDPLCFTVDESAFVAALKTIAAVPPGKSKAQETFSRNVCDALTEPDAVSRFERLHGAFFTKKHEPLKALQGFFDKQTDDLRGLFAGVIGRLAAARNARTEHAVLRMHARALPCAARLLEIFQQLKRSRQIIDFTDVEWHAFQLLSDGDDAAFMHAKLDSRYKHILLDEFQDTNPLQWQVMRAWLDGYGKDAGRPTVFVVGDPKQSIYRFRRAEPRLFEIAAELLATDYGAARLVRNDTRRCAPAIVQVVNATFAGNDEYPDFPLHVSLATAVTGRVEVLALARHPESAPESMAPAWRNPLLAPFREREDLRRNQEAALLAARIREIVGNWEVHDRAGSRPARFSDVMILKRNRTHLAVYEQALRNFDIPFLTSRLGGLLGTLEAADLCALIEVLIAPFDNLKLAHVLRSPLFSCSDDDLVQLARTRANDDDAGHSSWWHRLHAAAELGESASLVRAWRMLSKWQNAADAEPVHDLLDRIYHEGQVLARYHAACPPVIAGQVRANLDRFLELALELDGGRYPSLPRFVAELARLRTAPDQEAPNEGQESEGQEAVADEFAEPGEDAREKLDAVRILTIHGAKGLEAPIVWLIDAREGSRAEFNDVLVDWPPDSDLPRHFSFFTDMESRGHRRDALFDEQARLARRERLNLLYVAATRAQRYLFVSGIDSARAADPGSAYDRLAAAVHGLGEGAAVIGEAALAATTPAADSMASTQAAEVADPAFAFGAMRAVGARIEQSAAGRAGSLLHRMLEIASQTQQEEMLKPIAHRKADSGTLRELLARKLALSDSEFTPLWQSARTILSAPHLRRFFDPGGYLRAQNELEVISKIGLRRIDRLVEFDDEVWVLDYKTGAANEPDAWRAQLAEYRLLLTPIFAGKRLRCAVVRGDGSLEEFAA